jgi:23S rRNA pseudouridine2605 synthase
MILAGEIKVNEKIATLGMKISLEDRISIGGKPINLKRSLVSTQVILYHKPIGEICSRDDPNNRKTVYEILPKLNTGRWIGIGRLDINTSGLYLFTTDGVLANALIQPKSKLKRTYMARVQGKLKEHQLKLLKEGVTIDDQTYRFELIRFVRELSSHTWYEVSVIRGRNHEVRKLFLKVGYTINRLVRTKYGPITLPKTLKPGQLTLLNDTQISQLMAYQASE